MPEELRDFKLNDFSIDVYDKQDDRDIAARAKKICAGYVKNYLEIEPTLQGLYLYSYTRGSGKTRLAVSIGNALIDIYQKRVKFVTATKLISEIQATFNPSDNDSLSTSQYMRAIEMVDVLIIDDIGTEKLTDWVNQTFYGIINQRMLSKRITIYTSNCTVDELKHDERIKSRIGGNVYVVKCPEEDIRQKLGKAKSKSIEELIFK